MSRQRDYQKRMRFEGRCVICGDPAADSRRKNNANGKSPYCPNHLVKVRERNRDRAGTTRRNLHAGSYKEVLDGENATTVAEDSDPNSDDGRGEPGPAQV